ncbi:MAG: hypothetical protein WDN02_13800 [Methylovirgula sp.]|uniref:hypothetical protein n=1 Tax=Methylovirgula sp. TaxID=1978224 RepID=UPI003075F90B
MLCATGKILRLAFGAYLGASAAAAPALAQSGNGYGLSGLKSYDASLAPPANGLARVIRSENQSPASTPRKFKPDIGPAVTVHAFGEVIVDSTMRR